MPLPIRIREGPEPFSRRARTESPLLAESDAYRVLFRELERYVDGAVGGRSFLISGHRGSGKTTLVLQAVQNLETRRRSVPDGSIPLLVRLRGPELLPERPEDVGVPPKETKRGPQDQNGKPKGTEDEEATPGPPVPEGKGKPKAEGATQKEGNSAAEKPSVARDAAEIPSARLAEHVLIQITQAIYRALASRFADALDQHFGSEEASGPLPSWLVVERRELASQLRLALDEAPGPSRLRELWRRAGVLQHGVLGSRPPYAYRGRGYREPVALTSAAQAYRELVALASAAQAYRVVSGTFEEKRSGGASLESELSRETGASLAVKDAGRQLLALFAGGAAAAGLLLEGATGLLGGLAAAAVAVAVSWSLKLAGKRTAKRSVREEYSFLRDHSVSTLERELPVLVERLHRAGLAPVVMVDELDKVDLLPDRMEQVVDRLKHFVTEGAFFCFLTDRDYFEHLRDLALREPYPREYTYFTNRLLVLYRPQDLHTYLDSVLQPVGGTGGPGTAASTDLEVLPYVLLHRSRMHPVDLRRELVKLRGEGNQVALKPGEVVSALAYRYAVLIQLAVEALLARQDLAERLEQDPNFGQPVYDALYYPSRMWAKGETILDVGPQAFREYLTERMSPNRPKRGRRNRVELRAARSPKRDVGDPADPQDEPVLPLSDQDLDLLLSQVRELVGFLVAPHLLVQELDTTDTERRISAAAVQAIPAEPGDHLLEEIEPGRYWWRFGPYGRRLPPIPAEVIMPEAPADQGAALADREAPRPPAETPEPEAPRSRRGVSKPKVPVSFDDQLAHVGIDLEGLRADDRFLRTLNDRVIDTTGRFDLQRLADELFILARSPSWLSVREALDRLRQLELHGEGYPEMEQDAHLVRGYLEMLKQRGAVLAACFEVAGGIAPASPREEMPERVAEGLLSLASVFRFREMRTTMEMTDALRVLAPEVLSEEFRFTLGRDDFEQWWGSLSKWWDRSQAPAKDLTEIQVEAWANWNERLKRFVLTREARYSPKIKDLVCQVAGVPPTVLFEFDLRHMTLARWSSIVKLAQGWLAPGELRELPSKLGVGQTPYWTIAPALAQLGVGSLLRGLGLQESPLEFLLSNGPPPSDEERKELREWLDWIADRQPAWLEPRPTALILARPGSSLVEGWRPSSGFGGWMTWEPELFSIVYNALREWSLALPTQGRTFVVLQEFSLEDVPLGTSDFPRVSSAEDLPLRLVGLVEEAPPSELRPRIPLVIGPKSFDDAMQQALKLLSGAE